MKKFAIGQIVVCIDGGRYPETLQAVGTIERYGDVLERLMYDAEYVVSFPTLPKHWCDRCQVEHERNYPKLGKELKALDDPDKGLDRDTDASLEEEEIIVIKAKA